MSEKGWIKLHRELREHWVWEDPLLLKIWLDILLSANHEAKKIVIKGTVIEVGRGQFWTSKRKLASRWGIDKDTAISKIKLLQSDEMIHIDSKKGLGTLISVVNYGTYQGFIDGEFATDSVTDSVNDSDYIRFNIRSENRHKQEYKELLRMNKEDEEIEPIADPWGNELQ